jgi:multicomponent Na+:H+ antiporter subunit G
MELFIEILEIIGAFLILIGSIFLLLGAIGIYRMPDLYNRLQAGTKATTLGAMSLIFGVGLMQPNWLFKLIIIILFIAFANPLSSHALARASYRQGKKPYYNDDEDIVEVDHYEKAVKKEIKKLKKKLKEEV